MNFKVWLRNNERNQTSKRELNDFKVEVLTQLAIINIKLDGYPETKSSLGKQALEIFKMKRITGNKRLK